MHTSRDVLNHSMFKPITYRTGDATQPSPNEGIICHICNDVGAWGAGFVLALSRRWAEPELIYRAERPALGEVQIVWVAPKLYVANMVAQHGVGPDATGRPPIRYQALSVCLSKLSSIGLPVHMPRIGCGLAGGEWSEVVHNVEAELCRKGVDVYVYDLHP